MTQLFRRLRYLLNHRRFDRELAEEMDFHREMAEQAGGVPVGNTLRLREEARDAWGWTWIDRLFQDLRYGVRGMKGSPGFTLAAVLMLAIGIGANVAAFSFFDIMVLRPLPVRDPDTLVRFHRWSPQQYAYSLPWPEVAFVQQNARTLSAVLAVFPFRLSIEGDEKPVSVHFVSANYFEELGAGAALGRPIRGGVDDAPDAQPAVVLSDGLWRRRFGGDPQVVGRTIQLNGKPALVAGVASEGFGGLSLDETALWAPIQQQPYYATGSRLLTAFSHDSGGVQMFGRLRPGQTPDAAEAELQSLLRELRKRHPDGIWENETLQAETGGYAHGLRFGDKRGTGAIGADPLRQVLLLIGALVLLILAVTCANLGSLLLARGVARQREVSIRTAVGAGTGRLVRQLFTESVLLALMGSAAGLVVGYLILRNMMMLSGAPSWISVTPDWRVVLFAIGMAFLTACLFGLTPAFQIARQRHRATLLRQFLVGTQIAASCVLLILAGLLGRAMTSAMSTHPGFAWERLIAVDPGLARHGYSPERARAYLSELQTRLGSVPGVDSVALALVPPLGRISVTARVTMDQRTMSVQMNHIGSDYFQTLGIPLLRGRDLTRGATREIAVSESLAHAAWPGEDPLGKQMPIGDGYTVVGIVGSARWTKLEDSDSVEAYLPVDAANLPSTFVVVKTAGPPEAVAAAIASAARATDPATVPEVQLVKTGFDQKMKSARYSALAVAGLGLIAHLLACLGIVGVVSYAVSQRRKEIGIRMALGAKPFHVLTAILRQFLRPLVVGMVVGVAAAASLSVVLRGLLYGVSHLDLFTYVVTIALFTGTLLVAALLPARRSLRVDPLHSLRYE